MFGRHRKPFDDELRILELAERGGLPQIVADDSVVPRRLCEVMIKAGVLEGLVSNEIVGRNEVSHMLLSYQGFVRLAELRKERAEKRLPGLLKKLVSPLVSFVAGILTGVLVQWLIKYLQIGP